MNKKTLIDIAFVSALVIAIVTLLGFSSAVYNNISYKGLVVTIDHTNNGNFFVVEEDIKDEIDDMGYIVNSHKINEIEIEAIEKRINQYPSVQSANVFKSINGLLNIDIVQRKPIIRVFSNGSSFYIDEYGYIMPLSSKYTARVMVVNGNIQMPLLPNMSFANSEIEKQGPEFKLIHELYTLSKYITQNEFWDAQISQIFVNKNKEFELIPKVGNHNILFGNSSDLEEKFTKLRLFYLKGLNLTDWNQYDTINLKFKNQVVCTKKNKNNT